MTIAAGNRIREVSASSLVVGVERGGIEIVDKLADEWRSLCEEAVNDQPFYRPEWIGAHIRAFSPGATVLLLTVRFEGHLRFLLPMIEERATFSKIPVRRLRAPVDYRGCRFDALRIRSPEGDAAVQAAWQYLKGHNGWDLLQFQDTQEASTVSQLVAAARASGLRTIEASDRPNPFVPVPADPELLKQLPRSSRLRTKLRQVRREMTQQAPLKFYRLETADPNALARFYQLEASGWKGLAGSAIFCRADTRQFYDEIAQSAARFGYFALYMLEWKGELLAAHFSLTYKDRCYSPVVAYNENYKEFAPGHLIVSEILQDCLARGISSYDITGQDQEWKMKWTTEARTVTHHYVFRGLLGNLAYQVSSRLNPNHHLTLAGAVQNTVPQ